jgi:DNA-binding protein YbaB
MHIFTRFFRSKIEVDVENAVARVVERKLEEVIGAFENVDVLTAERSDADARRLDLESQIAGLEREAATLQEDMAVERAQGARDKLDVDHKLGLDKIRIEADGERAAKDLAAERRNMQAEQKVAVQSATLEAKTEAAKEAREQMKALMDRQENMIEKLLEAQPDHRIREKRGT